jgi:hypothetical protein
LLVQYLQNHSNTTSAEAMNEFAKTTLTQYWKEFDETQGGQAKK